MTFFLFSTPKPTGQIEPALSWLWLELKVKKLLKFKIILDLCYKEIYRLNFKFIRQSHSDWLDFLWEPWFITCINLAKKLLLSCFLNPAFVLNQVNLNCSALPNQEKFHANHNFLATYYKSLAIKRIKNIPKEKKIFVAVHISSIFP